MSIYKYEDGTITTEYGKDFDGSYPEVDFPGIQEVIQYIEDVPSWDAVDEGVYKELCDELGLDYSDYDDPDKLFDAIKEAANS